MISNVFRLCCDNHNPYWNGTSFSTTTTTKLWMHWVLVCSWIGFLCSIVAVTSCSFVRIESHPNTNNTSSIDWPSINNSTTIAAGGGGGVGPFRSYDAASHTCSPILLSTWTVVNLSKSLSTVVVVLLLGGLILLAIGGVGFGATALFNLHAATHNSNSHNGMDAMTTITTDTWKSRRTLYFHFFATCTCQILMLALFFLSNCGFPNTDATITLGWGAIVSITSILLYIISMILYTLLLSRTNQLSMSKNQNNYYAFFDVDYMEAFPTDNNKNNNHSLTIPLIVDNATATYDSQSNYGNLPPWVHTIQ